MANFPYSCDVFVNGLTPGGVAMAWQAARLGLKVVAAHNSRHIGGMPAAGLLSWDMGRYEIRHTGASFRREYFRRLSAMAGSNKMNYRALPQFNSQICWDMLEEYDVTVLTDVVLVEAPDTPVTMSGGGAGLAIATVKLIDRSTGTNTYTISPKITLEGEYEMSVARALAALGKLNIRIGREADTEYGESLAGFGKNMTTFGTAKDPVPNRVDGNLIFGIEAMPALAVGAADNRVQCMAFRVPIDQIGGTGNGRAWRKPKTGTEDAFRRLIPWPDKITITRVPTPSSFGATELNFDSYPSSGTEWATATWAQRGRGPDGAVPGSIWQKLYDEQAGYYYFLANDPRVPAVTRALFRKWGPLKDTFGDTGGWPRDPYLREGYRIVGDFVITQAHVQEFTAVGVPAPPAPVQRDTVSAASYPIDRHPCGLWEAPYGYYRDNNISELLPSGMPGSMLRGRPFQVPLRALLPQTGKCTNYGTCIGISATSVAYSCYRMEPHFMNAGNALAYAAYVAISDGVTMRALCDPPDYCKEAPNAMGWLRAGRTAVPGYIDLAGLIGIGQVVDPYGIPFIPV